jgi:membrane-bound serine protease (ClpP class)
MTGIIWAVVLLGIGLAVMMLEVFLPSGGVLGFVSAMAIVAAIVTAFVQQGVLAGFVLLGMSIGLVPTVLMVAFRWFPATPLGRRVLPPPPEPSDVLPQRAARDAAKAAVGLSGTVVDELVPWGRVLVADRLHEAMSDGGVVAAGTPIEVVGAQGTSLVVRRREATEKPAEPRPERPQPPPVCSETPAIRSETLEAFDFDSLDRPPA